MFLRRRRVFISYSRNEADLRTKLVQWLRAQGVVPVYDDAPAAARETVLAEHVARLIRGADGLIALGTQQSLGSEWVHDEVIYAQTLPQPPRYLPVLAEPIPHTTLPDWFLGKRPVLGEVRYVECFGDDDEKYAPLSEPIRAVRRGSRITLGAAVALALFSFLIVPLVLWWILRPFVDAADRDVREVQQWVENVNVEIGKGRGRATMIDQDEDSAREEVEYREAGELLARDTFDARTLIRRRYFLHGVEVAVDSVVTLKAPNGATSQVKIRRISPHGAAGPTIEDTFDSDGRLVSKRMRESARKPWRYFAEHGRTVYALYPFVTVYR